MSAEPRRPDGSIDVNVNGAVRIVPAGCTVLDLVRLLSLVPTQVAVERNKVIVRRAEHATTRLQAGDQLEIVTFFGGG